MQLAKGLGATPNLPPQYSERSLRDGAMDWKSLRSMSQRDGAVESNDSNHE
jgi:hypothetical protein